MKISTLSIIGLVFFFDIHAQDLKEIQRLWEQRNLIAAQQGINNYLQRQPLEVQGWLLKARVLNGISNDPTFRNSTADGKMEAFQALQRALKLDQVLVTRELQKDSFVLPLQLYNGYENDGIAAFNSAAEMNDTDIYAEALRLFKKAYTIGTFIYANKWGLQAIDSNNLYYSAKAAINAGNMGDAVMFSRKIADADITETTANKGFESIYQWLLYHYRTENNGQALNKYTRLAIENYPLSYYFDLNYIDWLRQQKKGDALIQRYRSMFNRGLDKAECKYAFILDLFSFYTDTSTNSKELLPVELKEYNDKNPADVKGKLLFGKYLINEAADIQKKMALQPAITTDPDLLKKYNQHIGAALKYSNRYLQEIADDFLHTDKAIYNEAVELLLKNLLLLNQPALAAKYRNKIK